MPRPLTKADRALAIEEAAGLARRQLRWTGERVAAVWEVGAGTFTVAAPAD